MSSAHLGKWILACVMYASASTACLAACTVSSTGIGFGTYDVFSALNDDITGTVTIRCRPVAAYALSLSPGSGSYASRAMTSGLYTLNYNLFLDPTRLTIWGDGSAGTGTVSGNARDATHNGRIPALQNAQVGSYTDTIIITITF